MGTPNLTATHMDRGGTDLVYTQLVHQIADGSDVSHRIYSTYLVEVDMLHRLAVNLAFCFSDDSVDVQHLFLYGIGGM